MNKTISANISGFIFNIEEDAYQKLLKYLEAINNFFKTSEGGDEIVGDIEARIAELFQERLTAGKQLITDVDVEEVIEIMGRPEQYDDGSAEEETHSHASESDSHEEKGSDGEPKTSNRRIYRDPDDKLLGGVCAGISHYLGWDPIILRLILVFAFFFAGTGVIIYILLWILVPEAKSTAEKLRMKGEKVNVENIRKKVSEEMDNVKENVSSLASDAKNAGSKVSENTKRAASGLGEFFRVIGKILYKLIGLILLMIGVGILIGSVAGWVAIDEILMHDTDWNTMQDYVMHETGIPSLGLIGLFMVVVSVIIAFIWKGLKILLDIKSNVKGMGLALFGIFLIGLVITIISGVRIGRTYGWQEDITNTETLDLVPGDTLFVNVGVDDRFNENYQFENDDSPFALMETQDGRTYMGTSTRMNFYLVDSGKVEVEVQKSACGRSRAKATDYADNIDYSWSADSNYVDLAPYFSVPQDDRWKCQEVDISIEVPVGVYVQMSDHASRIYRHHWADGKLRLVVEETDDKDRTRYDWEYVD